MYIRKEEEEKRERTKKKVAAAARRQSKCKRHANKRNWGWKKKKRAFENAKVDDDDTKLQSECTVSLGEYVPIRVIDLCCPVVHYYYCYYYVHCVCVCAACINSHFVVCTQEILCAVPCCALPRFWCKWIVERKKGRKNPNSIIWSG